MAYEEEIEQKITGRTYEECKEIARQFSSRSAFKAGNLRAYNASHSHKWMDDFFPKTK